MAKGDGHAIAKSTREERSRWHPHDFGNPTQDYPQLGRDVPWTTGPDGHPVLHAETRIQSYGEHGLRRETKCFHCDRWLTYDMCAGCQALFRLSGRNDVNCQCMKDSIWVYGHCEDHRRFEDVIR